MTRREDMSKPEITIVRLRRARKSVKLQRPKNRALDFWRGEFYQCIAQCLWRRCVTFQFLGYSILRPPSFSLCVTLLSAALTPAIVLAQPQIASINDLAQSLIDDTTPGIGVLVTNDGEVLHIAGYGAADIESETPVTPQSIFDLASVSKEMTALAARMQIEAGLYTQETPITDILPALAAIDSPRPLVVADLLFHMSGLPDYLEWEGYITETTNAEILEWLAEQELDHAPGVQFEYSNTGYLVLGSVVAAAEDAEDLAQVLEARVWGPLGMSDTALPDPADPNRRVTGYDGTGGDFDVAMEPSVAQGDGNVFSTLTDLAAYEAALVGGDLLDDTEALFIEGRLDDGKFVRDEDDIGYGYGWQVYEADGESFAAHSGSWMGTSTYYLRNLTTGVSVILLANGQAADLWELAEEIEATVE
jgi:CubicO group peptidase (beta-lactamase class C family)